MKNTPYVKSFNKEGELENPIKGEYLHGLPNRQSRRKKEPRFLNNKKTYPLQVIGVNKFRKHLQVIALKDGKGIPNGEFKTIEHRLNN